MPQHRIATRTQQFLKPAKKLTGKGQKEGRTPAGTQPDIGGNKNGGGTGRDENRHRLRPDHGNRRIRAMNLPVGEQGDSALVAWVRRVRMEQGMQPGENRHRLKQQENTEPQGRVAPFRLP
jgi:hypothetical protein